MKYSKFNLPMAFCLPKSTFFLLLAVLFSCGNQAGNTATSDKVDTVEQPLQSPSNSLRLGANRTETYLDKLIGKRVGIVGNQSSLVLKRGGMYQEKEYTHLVDSLLSLNVNVVRVLSPEHGFRGTADAGETVKDGKDAQTGLPIVSLYGKNKKPTKEQLEGIDVLVFDIQDVGVRFYTYIATMHYVMQTAAENQIPLIVFDRPNPNGHYVDGPVMEAAHTGFLGMHAGVPLVHGMTVGEYAQMINEEGWLGDDLKTDLTVVAMENYSHSMPYSLPVRPSPNLPNDQAINLYPSLGLMEGTTLNAGRGTEMQFQILGSPYLPKEKYPFSYTPAPNFGSKSPKHNGTLCNGKDLRKVPRMDKVNLSWIAQAYADHQKKENFFNTKNFTAHAGTAKLQKQIEAGLPMDDIRASWQEGIDRFKKIRAKYLIYP